jgi:ABC-type antimicrobial peptide transport system permease subunit
MFGGDSRPGWYGALALGADSRAVRVLIFRQSFRFVAAGFLIGLPASTVLSRFYSNLLFDVRPGNPMALVASDAILLGVAFLATYIPTARATREDATIALRIDQ